MQRENVTDYYPLTFEYRGMYQSYLWGGRSLARLVGAPEGEPVAELWAVSDRPEQGKTSRIESGPLAGWMLAEVIAIDPLGMLGFDPPNHRFPLLIKILDAAQPLSVQVHPSAAVAERLGGRPKAEAWLFLEGSKRGSSVFAGFTSGTTRQQLTVALQDGSIEQLLHRIPTSPGAVVDIPPGRVHGIGAGCLILEVQASSDTTYRVYDYNRVDPKTGETRPLHVEEALASLNFSDVEPKPEVPQLIDDNQGKRQQILTAEHFTMERFTGLGLINEQTTGVATIVANLKPAAEFSVTANGTSIQQKTFEFSLIPAAVGEFTVTGDDLDYVLIRPVKPTAAEH